MSDDELVEVAIALPLPMDIVGTLLEIVGLTWSGTVIKKGGLGQRELVLGIPNRQRHKSAKAAKKYRRKKLHLKADTEATINELDADGIVIGTPNWLSELWVGMARDMWRRFPDAPNYVESTVYDQQARQSYVFYVAKSESQTPHALRIKAEKERDRALADVAALTDRVAELEAVQQLNTPTRKGNES